MKKITVGILTYNHEAFIEKCLSSVLALQYDNLEIIVSDDCSKDNTFQIVKALVEKSKSSHSVIIHKNEVNVGLAENFNKIFHELATGEFLITLGGDDLIIENYLDEAVDYFNADKDLMMIDLNAVVIDELDNVKGNATFLPVPEKVNTLDNYLALDNILSFAPGRIFRNDLIKKFNPISPACPTEDSVLVVRALLLGKLCRLDKKVIHYRKHSTNISSIDNLRKLSNIRIIAQYIKDAVHLYDGLFFSDAEILAILRRFKYELRRREIFYSYDNEYIKRIKLNIHKRSYLLKLK